MHWRDWLRRGRPGGLDSRSGNDVRTNLTREPHDASDTHDAPIRQAGGGKSEQNETSAKLTTAQPVEPQGTSLAQGLLDVTRVLVPRELAEETQLALRKRGVTGHEALVLWAGRRMPGAHHVLGVEAILMPVQTAIRTADGIGLLVEGDELFRINVWLHQEKLTLVAQIHSHPGKAYHSDTDDQYAVVTTIGGLSLVAPNFARGPFALQHCAVYRLTSMQTWSEVEQGEARHLIEIIDSDWHGGGQPRTASPSDAPDDPYAE